MIEYQLNEQTILQSLPEVLRRDTEMQGLAAAIAETLGRHMDDIFSAAIYVRIDRLPEELCDILADDLKIDWYSKDFPLDVKRQHIKQSWRIHQSLGTVESVRRALTSTWSDAEIIEWFNYGGEPNSFKIRTTDLSIGSDLAMLDTVLQPVKRLAAKLESVEVFMKMEYTSGIGILATQNHMVSARSETVQIPAGEFVLTDENGACLTDGNSKLLTAE